MRYPSIGMLSLAALLLLPSVAPAQQKNPPGKTAAVAVVKPKIRAVTAFINLEPAQYQQQVAETMQMLRRAKTIFESRGYEVQTIRISTQPFPEYTKGLTAEREASLQISVRRVPVVGRPPAR